MTAPFVVRALGDAVALRRALDESPQLMDLRTRIASGGVLFEFDRFTSVTVPAFSGVINFPHTKSDDVVH